MRSRVVAVGTVTRAMALEKEISYTINLSQDLLYIIFNSYIVKHMDYRTQYCDLIDCNDVRTRFERGTVQSVHKKNVFMKRFAHYVNDTATIVGLVDRHSIEEDIGDVNKLDPRLRRIVRCQVYRDRQCPQIEIKFEHIYLNQHIMDRLDSLLAVKQMTLLNLLNRTNDSVIKNSQLGSDEILANIRLEYEYETEFADVAVIDRLCVLVQEMDKLSHYQNIHPLLAYTTIQNNIIYRKFIDERLLFDSNGASNKIVDLNIYKWALKLDGIRGRGFFTQQLVVIFMDDMQLFAGHLSSPFAVNNVVAFQCELLPNNRLYITDLLHVFKYVYNNKTQYECSLDAYDLDPYSAVACLNHMRHNRIELSFNTDNNVTMTICFQQFNEPPLNVAGYHSVPTDGFVVLDHEGHYVKYKHIKTIEVEYDSVNNRFVTLNGPVENKKIIMQSKLELLHGQIYEANMDADNLFIMKIRKDRLVPN
ncbi:LEF-4 [Helicoverpa armigera SNPV]|nr:LEF-4 [Helicoverpa armigera SNPV]